MDPNLFSVQHLSFAYGSHQVFQDLSLSLPQGVITTLIGANGCGKSTLLQLLAGILRPQKGDILLRGRSISTISPRAFAQQVAVVHQYNTAPADLTVEQLVGYGRTPYRRLGRSAPTQEDREAVRWALEVTHTVEYRHTPVSQLSGGQRQRVWMAMALAQGTKTLFLDEPTTYLDIRYQLEVLRLVHRLNREHGITIVMVLHDINQSLYYSDQLVAMRQGTIVAQGAAQDILTPELVEQVYGVHLDIHQVDGRPMVLPI